MVATELLNSIWSGNICVCQPENRSPLAALLGNLLSVPTVTLVAASGLSCPVAFADSQELAPGLALGDVLFEELHVDVPVNSVILLEPVEDVAAQSFSAKELGQNLGKILSSFADVNSRKRDVPRLQATSREALVDTIGMV